METKIPAESLISESLFFAVRSRGPGGQNVNKVSSAAILVWDIFSSRFFSGAEKVMLAEKLAAWLNRDGCVQVRSDEFRDLEQNKRRCVEKLMMLLKRALHKPKPRVATKPTRASRQRRMDSKSRRGQVKAQRRRVRDE